VRLSTGIVALAACAVLALAPTPAALAGKRAEAIETATPIKHFITLMQENHSFDNYFGTYPGANGIPKDLCMPVDPRAEFQMGGRLWRYGDREEFKRFLNRTRDETGYNFWAEANPDDAARVLGDARYGKARGGCIPPFRIGDKPVQDLGHSQRVFDDQYAGGRMDGFVHAIERDIGRVDPNVMGYYDDRDLPYYWNIADEFVLFDRFFTSSTGGSVRNHMYWVSGSPGNYESDTIPVGGFDDIPTIFDRLEEKGISWKFYVQNYDPGINFRHPGSGDRGAQLVWVPLLNYARFVDDPRLSRHIVDMEEFHRDLENGTLPAVSYLVPSGSSEHPPGSIQSGQRFVRSLINALMRSSAWSTSAFNWTYDDWGGFYDHVPPPQVDRFGYGFRAPALLVSPYARRGHVDSTTLDFTSYLKFIQENWGLEPLAERDRKANSIVGAFDFDQPPREAELVSSIRHEPGPYEPRRWAIFMCYFLAAAFSGTMIARAAGLRVRLVRERRARLTGLRVRLAWERGTRA
jgi:phospholipase C